MSDNDDGWDGAVVQFYVNNYVGSDGVGSLFRDRDEQDRNCNVIEYPIARSLGTPEIVNEGEHLSRAGTDFESVTTELNKFGAEVTSDESEESVVDAAKWLSYAVAEHAREVLEDELDVTYASVRNPLRVFREAMYEACGDELNPSRIDVLLLSESFASYIADADDTSDWDDIRSRVEEELGVEIEVDEHNVLRSGDVIVADRDRLGYRPYGSDIDYKSYDEYRNHDPMQDGFDDPDREPDRTVYQGSVRLGHVVLGPEYGRIVRFRRTE